MEKKAFFFVGLLLLSSFFKASVVWGSHIMFFSLACMLAPLSGVVFSFAGIFCSLVGIKVLLALFGKYAFFSMGIPTFAASLVWYYKDRSHTIFARVMSLLLLVVLPLAAMSVFYFHPGVGKGWVYALYWLVPVCLYVITILVPRLSNPFVTAFQSTFIAHAVGSVLWLFMMPSNEMLWISLIPLVFVERLVFASGMTLLYYGVQTYTKDSFIEESVSYATSGNDYGRQSSLGSK